MEGIDVAPRRQLVQRHLRPAVAERGEEGDEVVIGQTAGDGQVRLVREHRAAHVLRVHLVHAGEHRRERVVHDGARGRIHVHVGERGADGDVVVEVAHVAVGGGGVVVLHHTVIRKHRQRAGVAHRVQS